MTSRGLPVLGGMSADHFLARYWQRKPLVIRGAFPGQIDPLSPDELAGLACEPGIESRLVIRGKGESQWQVSRGPQRPDRLRRLPRSRWSLLIESLDRHSKEIAHFASPFSFLPKWRMDDVMVSLAPEGGTVDAHIDSYDVFLIQGQGRRKWEVDSCAEPDYKPGIDLRILKRFNPEAHWILDPGDMLYVPPGCGHRGVTVKSDTEIALTYSIGFRAPSATDLLSSILSRSVTADRPRLFGDAGRHSVRDPGEISRADINGLRRFLSSSLATLSRDEWVLAAGEAVTAGGHGGAQAPRTASAAIKKRLQDGRLLVPSSAARMSWAALEKGRAAIFVNGESRVLSRNEAFAAAALCGMTSPSLTRRLASNEAMLSLAADLLRSGAVGWKS